MSFAVQALTRSLNAFHLGGSACNNCDIEILDALTPKYDLERFGITLVGSIRHADLILPAAGWGEKEGTFINSERRIGLLKKVARAPGEALADFSIFQAIAQYWGCGDLFAEWSSPAAVTWATNSSRTAKGTLLSPPCSAAHSTKLPPAVYFDSR